MSAAMISLEVRADWTGMKSKEAYYEKRKDGSEFAKRMERAGAFKTGMYIHFCHARVRVNNKVVHV